MPANESPEPGLRERKKRETRAAIQSAALKLFLDHGYDATTTSQVARAANVSTGTLFNYFPTKEALLADDFDPVFIRHLRARPPEEPLFTAFRQAMRAGLSEARDDGGLSLARAKLIASTPALRAAMRLERDRDTLLLAQLLAERYDGPADDFELKVASTILVNAVIAAYDVWLAGDSNVDVRALVDRALAVAEAGGALQFPTREM